jgi:predicted phage-related endonuclease
MSQAVPTSFNSFGRRHFVGGSVARIIMGDDENALLRLWRAKRGEAEREDLSGNLVVQLGVVTEHLNRHWFEQNTGHTLKDLQRVIHPVIKWRAATLDGVLSTSTSDRREEVLALR